MEVPSNSFSLKSAIKIATAAHEHQLDKGGQPYINHPLRIMEGLEGEDAKMVAVLHDVVEDTDATFDDLRAIGCPEHVIDALQLLTHPKDYQGTEEEYFKGIQAIINSGNQLAIDVKWVDLTHNADISRIPNPVKRDLQRVDKYKKSMDLLRSSVSGYLLKPR